jgi:aminopeptidase
MINLEENLKKIVERKNSYFQKILKNCLKVKNEQILIISDKGVKDRNLSAMFSYGYYRAAKSKGFNVELLFQEVKKGFMHADNHVVSALSDLPKKSVIILSLSNKLGRIGNKKSFRNFCRENQHRFISATGLVDAKSNYFEQFIEAININYSRMKKRGVQLKKKLDKAKEVRIKTDSGTDLIFNVTNMVAAANIGEYTEEGTGGNIPAGEIYIPPVGYFGVNGKVVIDGSLKTSTGTILLNDFVTLYIKDGRVVRVEGKKSKLLEKTFQKYEDRAKYPYRVRHVGELGIGINPGAVLIGSTIMDEKVLGTAHIGIGSNHWFGGEIKTVYHGDQVFKNPKIYLDGKLLKL